MKTNKQAEDYVLEQTAVEEGYCIKPDTVSSLEELLSV